MHMFSDTFNNFHQQQGRANWRSTKYRKPLTIECHYGNEYSQRVSSRSFTWRIRGDLTTWQLNSALWYGIIHLVYTTWHPYTVLFSLPSSTFPFLTTYCSPPQALQPRLVDINPISSLSRDLSQFISSASSCADGSFHFHISDLCWTCWVPSSFIVQVNDTRASRIL